MNFAKLSLRSFRAPASSFCERHFATGKVQALFFGYGFIKPSMEGADDLFWSLGIEDCIKDGRMPLIDDIVTFDEVPNPKKPGKFIAINITGGTGHEIVPMSSTEFKALPEESRAEIRETRKRIKEYTTYAQLKRLKANLAEEEAVLEAAEAAEEQGVAPAVDQEDEAPGMKGQKEAEEEEAKKEAVHP
jgi:hypothetical protein